MTTTERPSPAGAGQCGATTETDMTYHKVTADHKALCNVRAFMMVSNDSLVTCADCQAFIDEARRDDAADQAAARKAQS